MMLVFFFGIGDRRSSLRSTQTPWDIIVIALTLMGAFAAILITRSHPDAGADRRQARTPLIGVTTRG